MTRLSELPDGYVTHADCGGAYRPVAGHLCPTTRVTIPPIGRTRRAPVPAIIPRGPVAPPPETPGRIMVMPLGTRPAGAWQVSVTAPYDGDLSKNRVWRHTRDGRTYINPAAKTHRDRLTAALTAALAGRPVAHNRLTLGLHITRGDSRGDAINALDLIADAVVDATGLDDRWYEVSGIRWAVDPANPHLVLTVGQDDVRDIQVCGGCGRELAYDEFGARSGSKTGRDGTCRRCHAERRKTRADRP